MQKFKKRECVIKEETCLEIQASQVHYEALRSQIANLIELHAMDADEVFVTSVLFRNLIEQATEAKLILEQDKKRAIKPYEEAEKAKGNAIASWVLEFDSCKLVYDYSKVTANADTDRFFTIAQVDEKRVHDIQSKGALYETFTDIINYILTAHIHNTTDHITPSISFQAVQKLSAEAMTAYENAKQEMINVMLPEKKNINWELDYGTGQLRYYSIK